MKKCFLLFFFIISTIGQASANVVIRGTRVIYPAGAREVSVQIKNTEKATNYLVQTWVSQFNTASNAAVPFVVTPPLNHLLAGRQNLLRLVYTGSVALPNDRESIYVLNVKSVPGVQEDSANQGNQLNFALQTQIKLFYRPENLPGNADTAYRDLIFSRNGNSLTVKNPTPYYITFKTLSVGGKPVSFSQPGISALMVPPFGEQQYTTSPGASGKVKWSALNDFGGVTTEAQQ